jgi:hypothetical protein
LDQGLPFLIEEWVGSVTEEDEAEKERPHASGDDSPWHRLPAVHWGCEPEQRFIRRVKGASHDADEGQPCMP